MTFVDKNSWCKDFSKLFKRLNIENSYFFPVKEKTGKEDYCDESLGDKRDRCLHDVLWQASRSFDAIKIAMPQRQVVLLTRNDDPLPGDSEERHKIRLRAKTNRDINVHLRIVGLKDDWDHKLFFRDLDVLANGCEPEDSEPTKLAQLENRLVFAAQTSGNLNWKIGEGLELPVRVTSFSRFGTSRSFARFFVQFRKMNYLAPVKRNFFFKKSVFLF